MAACKITQGTLWYIIMVCYVPFYVTVTYIVKIEQMFVKE